MRIVLASLALLAACDGFGDQRQQSSSGLDLSDWSQDGTPPDGFYPTYVDHIAPIMDALCVECHGENPVEDSPADFRLDQYDSNGRAGVYEMRERVVYRTVGTPADPMPVIDYLYQPTQQEKQILVIWLNNGGPYDASDTGLLP